MGEKIPYKARKPGGGRKKRKPEYDAGKRLKEQLDVAVVLYNSEMSLQIIADALSLNPIKVRKLLITAGVYESDTAKLVWQTFNTFRETQDYFYQITGENHMGRILQDLLCKEPEELHCFGLKAQKWVTEHKNARLRLHEPSDIMALSQ